MTEIDTSTEAVTALLDGVTDGPWKWWTSNSWKRLRHDGDASSKRVLTPLVAKDGCPDCEISQEDMAFIAAASDLVPALLAERDALHSEFLGMAELAERRFDELDEWKARAEAQFPPDIAVGQPDSGGAGYRTVTVSEPVPAAQDRDAQIAATLEMAANVQVRSTFDGQVTHDVHPMVQAAIRALATQTQTAALDAVRREARAPLIEALKGLCDAYAACNGEDHPAYVAARSALRKIEGGEG